MDLVMDLIVFTQHSYVEALTHIWLYLNIGTLKRQLRFKGGLKGGAYPERTGVLVRRGRVTMDP